MSKIDDDNYEPVDPTDVLDLSRPDPGDEYFNDWYHNFEALADAIEQKADNPLTATLDADGNDIANVADLDVESIDSTNYLQDGEEFDPGVDGEDISPASVDTDAATINDRQVYIQDTEPSAPNSGDVWISQSTSTVSGPVGTPSFWWPADEGSGTTLTDNQSSADGTINGATWVLHEDYMGNAALDANGNSDYVETSTWETFGSGLTSDFAIAFTIETADDQNCILGSSNAADQTALYVATDGITNTTPGRLNLYLRDDANGVSMVETATDITDGSRYRVFVNKISNDYANWELYLNGIDDTDGGSTASGDPFGSGTTSDFENPVTMFAYNETGTIERYHNSVLDDIVIYDDSLTESQVQSDYSRQPWS